MAETPNTQATTFTYADGSILTFEVRNLGSFEEADARQLRQQLFRHEGLLRAEQGVFHVR